MKIKDYIKSHKKMAIASVALMCAWILFVGIFYAKVIDVTYEKEFANVSIDESHDCIELFEGDVLVQEIQILWDGCTGISIKIPGAQKAVKYLDIHGAIYDAEHNLMHSYVYTGKDVVEYLELYMGLPSQPSPGTYYIELKLVPTTAELEEAEIEKDEETDVSEGSDEQIEETELAVPKFEVYKGDATHKLYATINGEKTDFCVSTYEKNTSWSKDNYQKLCVFVTAVLAIAIPLLFVILFVKKVAFHWCYAAVALVFGILFMFVIPPCVTPDELTHISTAIYISNQFLGWETSNENAAFAARLTEVTHGFSSYASRDVYNTFIGKLWEPVTETTAALDDQWYSLAAPYCIYTVPAIGITIARFLNLNGVLTILLGTLCNVLFFISMVTYGIKKAPFGKMILAGVCLLPMTLQQVSSFSYDNPIIAATVVVMALGLRWCYTEEKITKGEFFMYAFSSVILLIGKSGVYFMYIFLPFIYKFSKEKLLLLWKKYRWQTIGFTLAAAVIFLRGTIINFVKSIFAKPEVSDVVIESAETVQQVGNYIEWAQAEGYTVGYLLSHPVELIMIIYNTIEYNMDWYLGTTLGNSLGWFQIDIPWVVVLVGFFVVLLATVKPVEEQGELIFMDKLMVAFLAVVGVALCFAALLLIWTPKGSETILGVQGRYFLPPLIVGLFALRSKAIQLSRNIDRELLYSMFFVNIFVVYFVLRFSM